VSTLPPFGRVRGDWAIVGRSGVHGNPGVPGDGTGCRLCLASALQENRESPNIDAGSGFPIKPETPKESPSPCAAKSFSQEHV
jgi:hypothetical protein